jgi:uncharacterized membrane-anchored protein
MQLGNPIPPRQLDSDYGARAAQAQPLQRVTHLALKVPEITIYFWIIKLLSTAMGEATSDFLVYGINKYVAVILGTIAFVIAMALQLSVRRYIPWVYWLAVVMVAVFGTMAADVLHIVFNVPYQVTSLLFASALVVVLIAWYATERTLSIHTIYTTRRETFYWFVVLFTFALGTAGGDLIAEQYSLGYTWALLLFAGAIGVVAVLHYGLKLNAVLSFWLAYILTRPLGASTGDLLSSPRHEGGLGLGTTLTSVIFLGAILIVVTYLAVTKRDVSADHGIAPDAHAQVLVAVDRTAVTPELVEVLRERAQRSPATFHVLIANPAARAEVTEHERERHHEDGERVLALSLPFVEKAVESTVSGSVSIRHDPMDAIEEALHDGDFHEIVLSTLPHSVTQWLHIDLPHRVAHLGLPTQTVTAGQARAAGQPARPLRAGAAGSTSG